MRCMLLILTITNVCIWLFCLMLLTIGSFSRLLRSFMKMIVAVILSRKVFLHGQRQYAIVRCCPLSLLSPSHPCSTYFNPIRRMHKSSQIAWFDRALLDSEIGLKSLMWLGIMARGWWQMTARLIHSISSRSTLMVFIDFLIMSNTQIFWTIIHR